MSITHDNVLDLKELFKNKILVCAGSGGVGKTTVSSTLAWRAAQDGKKVLVFTIDPSKRLASCLGLEKWNGHETLVQEFSSGGQMWASMIEAKKIFDEFVVENSPDKKSSERLLENRLYQELSTSLNGSQEFTSLQALYKAAKNSDYDLIIMDTPPAQHTLDFIESPQVIFNLFNGPIVDWFVKMQEKKNSLFSVFNQGTLMALSVLEKLTGSEFLHELQDFFKSVSGLTQNIQKTVIGAQNLLSEPTTQFVIVCNADDSKLQDAQANVKEFKKRGFQVHYIIVNRIVPTFKIKHTDTLNEKKLFEFYSKLKHHSNVQVQKIVKDDSRHFKMVRLWALPQTEHLEDELQILKNLANKFTALN